MRPAEVLLRHQRLADRARSLAADIAGIEKSLAANPVAERIQAELGAALEAQQELQLRLRGVEREVEGHRDRMRTRERELMSGRVRVPSELVQMSTEVEHMKTRLKDEEEQELILMEQVEEQDAMVERLQQGLRQALAKAAEAAPELLARLELDRAGLARAESERDEAWVLVPAAYKAAAQRIRSQPVIAEVLGSQCAACRVSVTSSAMQTLRRADDVVNCDNCGRVLVMA